MRTLRLIAWLQSLRALVEILAAFGADDLDAIGHGASIAYDVTQFLIISNSFARRSESLTSVFNPNGYPRTLPVFVFEQLQCSPESWAAAGDAMVAQ
jgi:hypothetical protein